MSSVSFSEEITVNKIKVENNERREKKEIYRKIRKDNVGKSCLSRVLYSPYQREQEYVDLKMKGKSPIRFISSSNYIYELYREGNKKIAYTIFKNSNNKLTLNIKTRGLGQKFYKEYYDMGCDLESMYVAEYKAKTKLIKIVRMICEDYEIY